MLELIEYLEKMDWSWELLRLPPRNPSDTHMYFASVEGRSCRCGHADSYVALLCAVAHMMTNQEVVMPERPQPSGDNLNEHDAFDFPTPTGLDTLGHPNPDNNVHTLKPRDKG